MKQDCSWNLLKKGFPSDQEFILRKFEQKGIISLESFLKLLLIVGGLEEVTQALKPSKLNFTSIDEVIKAQTILQLNGLIEMTMRRISVF